jgi:nucleotide-binding universal stress UspA family protein
MATHGYSAISRFFIGSTTERVVRHASCPVLIVREREREFV